MLGMRFTRSSLCAALLASAISAPNAHAAPQEHGRKWKPLPPTAPITVTVVKGFNNKPFENAGVVFHAIRDGKSDGNLEVKTDPEVVPLPPHVTFKQARGFMSSMLKGDEAAGHVIGETARQVFDGLFGKRD